MAILDLSVVSSQALPSSEELLANSKAQIKANITQVYNQLFQQSVSQLTYLYREVWLNELGLTPQQVVDSFGTDAGELMNTFSVLRTAVGSLIPDGIGLADPHTVTVNEDGTVTIGS